MADKGICEDILVKSSGDIKSAVRLINVVIVVVVRNVETSQKMVRKDARRDIVGEVNQQYIICYVFV
jgi:hypothetical protein